MRVCVFTQSTEALSPGLVFKRPFDSEKLRSGNGEHTEGKKEMYNTRKFKHTYKYFRRKRRKYKKEEGKNRRKGEVAEGGIRESLTYIEKTRTRK